MRIVRHIGRTVLFGALLLTVGCATSSQSTLNQTSIPSYWPTQKSYPVTSAFGMRYDPYTKKPKAHNGVDIAAPNKSEVYAAGSGRVIFSGKTSNGYGNLIGIDHGNGVETWYAHLSKRKAKEGRSIKQGEVIGKVGKSGRATGPHLHFEVRERGLAVDPAIYILPEPAIILARE